MSFQLKNLCLLQLFRMPFKQESHKEDPASLRVWWELAGRGCQPIGAVVQVQGEWIGQNTDSRIQNLHSDSSLTGALSERSEEVALRTVTGGAA